jgi:hypothetical protein
VSGAQSIAPPQPFRWDGEAMIPRRPRTADKLFVIGQDYDLVEHEDRSPASHRGYFASVGEVWRSLPDDMVGRFPTADALRKEVLKATGWCDTVTEVCSSNAEARRWAERLRKYMPADAFPTITVAGCAVVVITAKSQAYRAMTKDDFRASSDAVLKFLAEKIGVDPAAIPATEAA